MILFSMCLYPSKQKNLPNDCCFTSKKNNTKNKSPNNGTILSALKKEKLYTFLKKKSRFESAT